MVSAKHILAPNDTGSYCLLEENLKSILLTPEVIDKQVIVISVAGAFRKGKSFLLNMMLRYLLASDKDNWLEDTNSETAGFPWRGGYKADTTGILMYSKPIPVSLPSGEEAVIILMDTQGAFDNHSTMQEVSTVFALSTLLSSLQIYNVMTQLQSDDLGNLQLFTEYGRLAMSENKEKPFQKLLMLVRDWRHVEDLPLGSKGGDELVAECLRKDTEKEELVQTRKHIHKCFTHVNGFLLPPPGEKIASGSKANSADMNPRFAKGLKDLMPKILAPENLVVKRIAGSNLKAGDLAVYITQYFDLFTGEKLPKPQNILTATAEANNMSALHEAKALYDKEMSDLAGGNHPSVPDYHLLTRHRDAARKAETAFRNRKKMGDIKMSEPYLKQLLQSMEYQLKLIEQSNILKREMEKKRAEKHNMDLADKCKESYTLAMKEVAGENVSYVVPDSMEKKHSEAKRKTMLRFEQEKLDICNNESRFMLNTSIDTLYRQMLYHNANKKNVKYRRLAQATARAVAQAKDIYSLIMNTVMTGESAVTTEELKGRHEQAKRKATEKFASLKEGDDDMVAGYRENMMLDIDRELDNYIRFNNQRAEMEKIKEQLRENAEEIEAEETSYLGNIWDGVCSVGRGAADVGAGLGRTVMALFGKKL